MTTDRPRTPTERRAARAEVVALIVAVGTTPGRARATNAGFGWPLIDPDGAGVIWRWGKGEFAALARAVEAATGRAWGDTTSEP